MTRSAHKTDSLLVMTAVAGDACRKDDLSAFELDKFGRIENDDLFVLESFIQRFLVVVRAVLGSPALGILLSLRSLDLALTATGANLNRFVWLARFDDRHIKLEHVFRCRVCES